MAATGSTAPDDGRTLLMSGTRAAGGLDGLVRRVAERSAAAWWNYRGHGELTVPLGVIAALCLADGIDRDAVLAASAEETVRGMRRVWAAFWSRRPDLCGLCGPLAGWLDDEPLDGDLARAAAAVAKAAVRAGICDLAAGHLEDADLIGCMYMTMQARSAAKWRGEFYTDGTLCELMARMTLDRELRPGMSIAEPAAGTGGMVRAAAKVLRERGHDPADFWWFINDVSPLATAMLAVNCALWRLGPRVVIAVADTLADPDWPARAWAQQQAAVRHRDQLARLTAMLAAARQAEDLISGLADGQADPDSAAAVTGAPDIELPGVELMTAPRPDSGRVPASRSPRRAPRRRAAGRGRRPAPDASTSGPGQ